jgi:palmitoyltransferase ZDHHC9/14/18
MGFYALGASLAHLIVFSNREHISFGKAIEQERLVFALVVYAALAIPYPLALMAYHVFLMGRGETTRELLNGRKFVKSERHRPFNMGNVVKNYMAVLFRPRPPSYVEVKRKYEEGDQRFAEKRTKGGYTADNGGMEMQKLGEGLPGLEMRPYSGAAV